MELKAGVIIIVGTVLLATPTLLLPTGAPTSACNTMTPGHGNESTAALPYNINVSGTNYNAGFTITVTVAGPNFMGILMQVRNVGPLPSATAFGTWSNLPANTRLLTCANSADSVTHANTNNKQNAVFTWTAPQGVTNDLQVIATVAQARFTWWKGVTSATLTHDPSLAPTIATNTSTDTTSTASTDTPTTIAPTTSSMSRCIGTSAPFMFIAILVALPTLWFY